MMINSVIRRFDNEGKWDNDRFKSSLFIAQSSNYRIRSLLVKLPFPIGLHQYRNFAEIAFVVVAAHRRDHIPV